MNIALGNHGSRSCQVVASGGLFAAALLSTMLVSPTLASASPAVPSECLGESLIQNGSFEQPSVASVPHEGHLAFFDGGSPSVVWSTTDPYNRIELWDAQAATPPYAGDQFAELQAHDVDTVYQTMETEPESFVRWRVAHRARDTTPVKDINLMRVEFASASDGVANATTLLVGVDSEWRVSYGWYKVPAGQSQTQIRLRALSAQKHSSVGNLVDDVDVREAECR